MRELSKLGEAQLEALFNRGAIGPLSDRELTGSIKNRLTQGWHCCAKAYKTTHSNHQE